MDDWKQKSLFPFWELPKNKNLVDYAKSLRKQGILAEVIFWKNCKNSNIFNYDIDRQVIIGNYIVDFLIPELGLIFEIDGSSHDFKFEEDRIREIFLEKYNLKVIHIQDREVLSNMDGVQKYVIEKVLEREEELKGIHPVSPADCHPSRGEFKREVTF